MNSRGQIDELLRQKRLALVVSRNPRDFSRSVWRAMRARGFKLVNPHAVEVDGLPCSQRVQDIAPTPHGALLMTPAATTGDVVGDCASAGVRRVRINRASSEGAVRQAVDFCRRQGIEVIAGECPFMFLPGTT
jgi:acyl-CoA synthetase (NDP forming)